MGAKARAVACPSRRAAVRPTAVPRPIAAGPGHPGGHREASNVTHAPAPGDGRALRVVAQG